MTYSLVIHWAIITTAAPPNDYQYQLTLVFIISQLLHLKPLKYSINQFHSIGPQSLNISFHIYLLPNVSLLRLSIHIRHTLTDTYSNILKKCENVLLVKWGECGLRYRKKIRRMDAHGCQGPISPVRESQEKVSENAAI